MKTLFRTLVYLLIYLSISCAYAKTTDNQTATVSPVYPETGLPFRVIIEQAGFTLPVGFHSGAVGVYKGLWVFIAGRTNGLHGFNGDPFPPDSQNTSIYIVNVATGIVTSRALNDPGSGLTQQQIDSLSVTSPQFYQDDNVLYMSGGYGVDTSTGTFGTKPVFTAFNLPGIIKWVNEPGNRNNTLVKNMQQIFDPVFQITGGKMFRLGNLSQLVFGQDFEGVYTPGSNGIYSRQVRQFKLKQVGGKLSVDVFNPNPLLPDPSFRRRDLNIVPSMLTLNGQLENGLVAYGGVFTESGGAWTVPVVINRSGMPMMADPNSPTTFMQAMNQYVCATASIYSKKFASNYHIFFGGISFGYFTNGVFQTDPELPFINDVTTIQMDRNGNFTQYIMSGQYPVILSTRSNPGNQLLFGAGAYWIPNNILLYPNSVISLDNIRKPTVIGYIVGGIQSTLANTNTMSDSSASPYIFKVTLVPV